MIWTLKNSKGMQLVDSAGTVIPCVYEFNEETSEVKFYLTGKRNGKTRVVLSGEIDGFYNGKNLEVIQVSAIVKGAKMVPRETK